MIRVCLLFFAASVSAVGPAPATQNTIKLLRQQLSEAQAKAAEAVQRAERAEDSLEKAAEEAAKAKDEAQVLRKELDQAGDAGRQLRAQLNAERAKVAAAEQRVAQVQQQLKVAENELTAANEELHTLRTPAPTKPVTLPPTRAERFFGGVLPGHRRCWSSLHCPSDCTLQSPCASGAEGNQLYKNEFCDDYTGRYVCKCASMFSEYEQVRYSARQRASKPFCPESDQPTTPPTMMPHEFKIGAPSPENGWQNVAKAAQQVAAAAPSCPSACLGGAGNVRVKGCNDCQCASCPAKLFKTNCGGVIPAPCVAEAPKPIAGVNGDPFTFAKDGTKVQFYLPLHKDMKLLGCGDFTLYGSTRGSGIAGDSQQWFEQFRVLIDGDEKLRCGLNSMKTSVGAGNLTTMAVSIEGHPIRQPTEVVYGSYNIDVAQNKRARIGRGFIETVHFSSGGTTLEIKTALAAKEMSEELQLRYIHLDLGFTALNQSACTSGLMAEIWGNVQMSAETEAMLQPPSQY